MMAIAVCIGTAYLLRRIEDKETGFPPILGAVSYSPLLDPYPKGLNAVELVVDDNLECVCRRLREQGPEQEPGKRLSSCTSKN